MKKILVFCFVFVICFSSFGIVANAQTVEEPFCVVTALDFYNYYNTNYRQYFEFLEYSNGVTTFRTIDNMVLGSLNLHTVFGVPYLDGSSTYHFNVISNGVNIRVKYSNNEYDVFPNNDITVTDVTRLFLFVQNVGYFSEFRGFTVTEVPDSPPVNPDTSGNSFDFGNFIIPMARTMSVDTWNVFKSCWWALAFILIPLVYFLVITFIGLFKSSKPKYKNKYKANKFNYNGLKKSDKDFKKHFKAWVVIDGVRYYRSRNNFQKQPVE